MEIAGLVEGQVAVVTGAASGIGRAIAQALAREGARAIVVADIRDSPREGGTPTHESVGCEARFVQTDVSKPAEIAAAVDVAEALGGIDIMVNNAGIVVLGDFLDFTEEQYDRQMNVNAKGAFFGTQAAARKMLEKDPPTRGSIVNVSSIAGIAGNGMVGAYCASKGAIRLLTYAAAHALGPKGIRVNALHPGVIATEMVTGDFGLPAEAMTQVYPIPLGRAGTPDDIGDAAVLLCSEHARYVNGSSLVVDGGLVNSF